MADFKEYFRGLSGSEKDHLAKVCGTSKGYLSQIAYKHRPCGEGLAIEIEKATSSAVRCEDLRPDVDWQYLRGSNPIQKAS